MADHTDFSNLYRALGLDPGCDLIELRLAYRRRVAALHPDRHHDDGDELRDLNALYSAALDFRRRNGRLPGAAPQRQSAIRPATAAPVRSPTAASTTHASATASTVHGTRLRSIALLLLTLLFAALAWSFADDAAPGNRPAANKLPPGAGMPSPRPLAMLAPGMAGDDVRRIEGEPIHADATHWEYGPSWVAFHCGKVRDWYSSPLHPLHAPSEHAPPSGAPLPRCRATANPP